MHEIQQEWGENAWDKKNTSLIGDSDSKLSKCSCIKALGEDCLKRVQKRDIHTSFDSSLSLARGIADHAHDFRAVHGGSGIPVILSVLRRPS